MERLKKILSSYKGKEDELISILQAVQQKLGYLPQKAMLEIAEFLNIPESKVYGVASFYADFRFKPIGKNIITVCRGTACHVRGSSRILEKISKHIGIGEGETSKDMKFTLETVACIGACGLSPCIMINKKIFGKMTPRKVGEFFLKGDLKYIKR